MNLNPIIQEIADATGKSASIDRGMIIRKINVALEMIDWVEEWRFTYTPFSESVTSGNTKALVDFDVFRPLYAMFTDSSGNTGPLNYVEFTDFQRENAEWGTGEVTTSPDYYSLGGNYIYVGYGVLATDITVSGEIRRKLAISDVDKLPAALVISKVIMLIAKVGEPEYIMARADWKEAVKLVRSQYKATAEKRSRRRLGRQLMNNWYRLRSKT